MGALCVTPCMVLAAIFPAFIQSHIFQSIVFPKTPVSHDPISKLAASQFLLLSLVSTWHLSHCFQAHISFPCLFRVFLLLLLQTQLPPGTGSPAESELNSPLSAAPCFFMLLLPITFSRSKEFLCEGSVKSYTVFFY